MYPNDHHTIRDTLSYHHLSAAFGDASCTKHQPFVLLSGDILDLSYSEYVLTILTSLTLVSLSHAITHDTLISFLNLLDHKFNMVTSTRKQSGKMSSQPARKEGYQTAAALTQQVTTISTRAATAIVPPSPHAPPATSNEPVDITKFSNGNLCAADLFGPNRTSSDSSACSFNFTANGIAVSPTRIATKTPQDKSSFVRLAIIPNQALIFRIQPKDPDTCSWAEKVMMDDVKKPAPWVIDANIASYVFTWFQDNQKMLNTRGYGIRLFAIYVQETTSVTDESLLKLGSHIAQVLTEHEKNDTVVTVPSNGAFFWNRDATWQDLIGTDAALNRLRFNTGPFQRDGYYQQNIREIDSHFRPGTFTIELACTLFAPLKDIDPVLMREVALKKLANRRAVAGLDPENVALSSNFNLPPTQDDSNDVIDLHNNNASDCDDDDDEVEMLYPALFFIFSHTPYLFSFAVPFGCAVAQMNYYFYFDYI